MRLALVALVLSGCSLLVADDHESRQDGSVEVDASAGDLAMTPDLAPRLVDCGDAGTVDVANDPNHCGSCDQVCEAATAANSHASCAGGKCGTRCDTGWGDCNGGDDGCEQDLTSDFQNCGSCSRVCGVDHAITRACMASVCTFNCEDHYAHCTGDGTLGCETALKANHASCGACGYDCGLGTCSNSACLLTGGEAIGTNSSLIQLSWLAQNTSSIYWRVGSGSDAKIRAADKSTGAVTTVWTNTTSFIIDPVLAVDDSYVYFVEGATDIMQLSKDGSQAPVLVTSEPSAVNGMVMNPAPSAGTHALVYGETSHVDSVRVSPTMGTPEELSALGYPSTLACARGIPFFTIANDDYVYWVGSVQPLMTYPLARIDSPARAIATDDAWVYVVTSGSAPLLQRIPIGQSSVAQTMLTSTGADVANFDGGSQTTVVTDGTDVYIATGQVIYRAPVDVTGTFAAYRYHTLDGASFEQIKGAAVDGTSLYFATQTRIVKLAK